MKRKASFFGSVCRLAIPVALRTVSGGGHYHREEAGQQGIRGGLSGVQKTDPVWCCGRFGTVGGDPSAQPRLCCHLSGGA